MASDPKPQHKATYASDKKTGGYLIRVEGPSANAFAGKEVPTMRKGDTVASGKEKLTRLVWAGKDQESGAPVALYTFEARPREVEEIQW